MNRRWNAFNIYLPLALGAAVLAGCASPPRSKDAPVVRIYLEVTPDGTGNSEPVPIGRRPLFEVNVLKTPFLTEFQVRRAEVRDDRLGGYEMVLEFNRQGRWLLEEASTNNKGRRAVVFALFDKTAHWIAAPVMKDRITEGRLVFTPDLARVEAETLARKINEEEARQKIHDY